MSEKKLYWSNVTTGNTMLVNSDPQGAIEQFTIAYKTRPGVECITGLVEAHLQSGQDALAEQYIAKLPRDETTRLYISLLQKKYTLTAPDSEIKEQYKSLIKRVKESKQFGVQKYISLFYYCYYYEIMEQLYTRSTKYEIPKTLYMYFDQQTLPKDVASNIKNIQATKVFNDVQVFHKQSARSFLEKEYSASEAEMFDKLRHPAEEADFFRLHAIHAKGGYWSDVDVSLKSNLSKIVNHPRAGAVVFASLVDRYHPVARQNVLENCFLGCESGNSLISRAINNVHAKCTTNHDLNIYEKTGPVPLTWSLIDTVVEGKCSEFPAAIYTKSDFFNVCQLLEPEYKKGLGDWRKWELARQKNK